MSENILVIGSTGTIGRELVLLLENTQANIFLDPDCYLNLLLKSFIEFIC